MEIRFKDVPASRAIAIAMVASMSGCQDHPARQEVRSSDCYTCHQPEYEDPANAPPHPGLFPTSCSDCHVTDHWVPAMGLHHDWWPLENAHTHVPCASCHTVGYRPGDTPNTCVGCHRADYDSSPYPGHSTFSLECQNCHTTVAWRPALAHPEQRFPIQSGPHSGIECTTCHNAALGGAAVNADCIDCHTHARAIVDDQHGEVGGYSYDTARPGFCLDCHPNGLNN